MERVFKFGMGDVVRLKDGDHLVTPDGKKEYREHLTVMYYFWGGVACCYVLSTGDDDICVICDEQSLELEERTPIPMPVEEAKAEESHFLGSVFLINRRLVAAEGLEKAIELFHSHPSHRHETIRSITLQDPDPALIQNGKED